jgi:rhodanese-related sulfurtransferase
VTQIRQVSPEETQALLAQGHLYVDVRSEPEFEAGHVPGSLNVPLLHRQASGLVENAEFPAVMQSSFGKDEPLIVGCRSGNRSLRAARLLIRLGFTNILEMSAGWDGSRDPFGRPLPGWSKKDLPIETGAPAGQRYADIKTRKQG